jgi:hypothetical protein
MVTDCVNLLPMERFKYQKGGFLVGKNFVG